MCRLLGTVSAAVVLLAGPAGDSCYMLLYPMPSVQLHLVSSPPEQLPLLLHSLLPLLLLLSLLLPAVVAMNAIAAAAAVLMFQGAGKWLGRKVVTTVEVCVGQVCINLERTLLMLLSCVAAATRTLYLKLLWDSFWSFVDYGLTLRACEFPLQLKLSLSCICCCICCCNASVAAAGILCARPCPLLLLT